MSTAETSGTDSYDLGVETPRLSKQQEHDLIIQAQAGDIKARNLLVTSNLRFIIKCARAAGGSGHSPSGLEDRINLGVEGMIHAIKKFDPNRGVRLLTYAKNWIRQKIRLAYLINYSLVKFKSSPGARVAFSALKNMPSGLSDVDAANIINNHARKTKVRPIDVARARELLSCRDLSLNLTATADKNKGKTNPESQTFQDLVVDGNPPADELVQQKELKKLLRQALSSLTPKERDIIKCYVLDGDYDLEPVNDKAPTLASLGEKYGVTRERIRQIKVTALGKLQKWFLKHAPDEYHLLKKGL